MPAIQRSEFALALNQVANERGVDPSVVLDTVKNAILAAYRKDHPDVELEEYAVTLNNSTGEARILHKEKDVTPPGFGRIAAQTAKQVILQKIREKEKEAIFSDYRVKIGTIVNGMVLRFAGPNIIVDIGKTEGLMPPQEQISHEKYHLNQRLTVHLVEIREGLKGEEIVVSRANNGLIEGLFKREVPEIAQGSVTIKAIAREPGNRAKIAVFSEQPGIDPVGSCVGQKGVRVQAIIQEFNGIEKIDIIQWQDDPKAYVAAALSPAKNVEVRLSEPEKTAYVKVPRADLSLAIGKEGQNVRLASKLTGYRIEVEGAEEPEESSNEEKGTKERKETKGKDEKAPKKKSKKEASEGLEKKTEEVALSEEKTPLSQGSEGQEEETADVSLNQEKKDDTKKTTETANEEIDSAPEEKNL